MIPAALIITVMVLFGVLMGTSIFLGMRRDVARLKGEVESLSRRLGIIEDVTIVRHNLEPPKRT